MVRSENEIGHVDQIPPDGYDVIRRYKPRLRLPGDD